MVETKKGNQKFTKFMRKTKKFCQKLSIFSFSKKDNGGVFHNKRHYFAMRTSSILSIMVYVFFGLLVLFQTTQIGDVLEVDTQSVSHEDFEREENTSW